MNSGQIILTGAIGIVGTILGTFLGPFLAKTWQREQWFREKRLAEYREVLTSIAGTYLMLVRSANYEIGEEPNGPPDDNPQPTNMEIETYKVLRDRIFIAAELESENILTRWDEAVTNFRHSHGSPTGKQMFSNAPS